MTPHLTPSTPAELAEMVRSKPMVIVVGAGTKPGLSRVAAEFTRISTVELSGIVEYEPSEFTFTALAGTPLKVIVAALAERGQYLPFDPLLAQAGATIGGTVAAGLSGPGRFRFGGLRDFILGVRFVDGTGRLLRMGGKVVKNAAGFDLPKFFVGGAGRFGALADVTFKVFPKPAATRTLRIEANDPATKGRLMAEAGGTRWEFDAIDCGLEEGAVFARIAGPAAALGPLAADILARWPGEAMTDGDAAYLWQSVVGLRWSHTGGTLAKVSLTPRDVPAFIDHVRAHAGARGWVSAGGNTGYVSVGPETALPALSWPAVRLRGESALWPGAKARFDIMARVKSALDPDNRFPGIDD